MRKGFTMIELIFVIVIIGILAAIAVPRISGTRDDAKISAQLASGKQVIDNLFAEYTATGALPAATITAADNSLDCFHVAAVNGNTGVSIAVQAKSAVRCPNPVITQLRTLAANNGLTNANGAAKTYTFAGSTVVR